jgi:hypothetical protein
VKAPDYAFALRNSRHSTQSYHHPGSRKVPRQV